MKVGIDLGGSKIEAAIIDDTNQICHQLRRPTAPTYAGILSDIQEIIAILEKKFGPIECIGIGAPGTKCKESGCMVNANNTALQGNPFEADLQRLLEIPVRIANDAHCFALSEAMGGAAAGAEVVFGVICGTGTGGGIVVNGKIMVGHNGIGGEWGHNPLPWLNEDEYPGPACYCGQRGCIEQFLSGSAFREDHQKRTGEDLDGKTIVEHARSGDEKSIATIHRYANRMARAFASIINLLDPDVIVLGGGLSQIDELYTTVPTMWDAYVYSPTPVNTKFVKNHFGDASGVRGAAWLWSSSRED